MAYVGCDASESELQEWKGLLIENVLGILCPCCWISVVGRHSVTS